jgi:hypothetical protein
MLRDPFLNLFARHGEQTIRQFSKGLKFLRRTAHIASMIAPLALSVPFLSAQSLCLSERLY